MAALCHEAAACGAQETLRTLEQDMRRKNGAPNSAPVAKGQYELCPILTRRASPLDALTAIVRLSSNNVSLVELTSELGFSDVASFDACLQKLDRERSWYLPTNVTSAGKVMP